MIEAQRMWVGADPEHYSYKRYVIAKCKDGYVAVSGSNEEAFLNGYVFRTQIWKCAKPIELTAVVRSAEEIMVWEGVTHFSVIIETNAESRQLDYLPEMNKLAGKRIEVKPVMIADSDYDYIGEGFKWLKSWLKDFKEEAK